MLKNPIAADALPWLNVAQQLCDRRGTNPRHGTNKFHPPYGYPAQRLHGSPLIATQSGCKSVAYGRITRTSEIDEPRTAYLIRAGLK